MYSSFVPRCSLTARATEDWVRDRRPCNKVRPGTGCRAGRIGPHILPPHDVPAGHAHRLVLKAGFSRRRNEDQIPKFSCAGHYDTTDCRNQDGHARMIDQVVMNLALNGDSTLLTGFGYRFSFDMWL